MLRILLILVTPFISFTHSQICMEDCNCTIVSRTETNFDACIILVAWDSRSARWCDRCWCSDLLGSSSSAVWISCVILVDHRIQGERVNHISFWTSSHSLFFFLWCRSCNCRAIQDGLWFTLQLRGVDVPGVRSSWQRSKLLETVCGVSKRPFIELRVWEHRLDLQLACGTNPTGVLQHLARQVGAVRLPLLQRHNLFQLPHRWLQLVRRTCW